MAALKQLGGTAGQGDNGPGKKAKKGTATGKIPNHGFQVAEALS